MVTETCFLRTLQCSLHRVAGSHYYSHTHTHRDYINDKCIYCYMSTQIYLYLSVWICVFPLSCVCCQEREGGPFRCSVVISSRRATKHNIQHHNYSGPPSFHHSARHNRHVCGVNKWGDWAPELNTDPNASLSPEPSQVSPGGSLIRSDVNTTEGFPSMA